MTDWLWTRLLSLTLYALLALSLSACATVQPWERGRLAHDCMKNPVDAVEMARFGHIEAVREGSAGGATAGGGGCGCN